MNKERTVLVELNEEELSQLINDTINKILEIKKRVFKDAWEFSTNITETGALSKEEQEELTLLGYYERKALLDKLREIRNKEFPELTCCG